MRNSNVMAIAPTATIANITGLTQSIEPTYSNLFVKSNLSGEFTSDETCILVRRAESLEICGTKLWSMILKIFNGSLD
jgi:ribonucleoside-diphosphate reductase alpha chain